jgi:hypothetical protein
MSRPSAWSRRRSRGAARSAHSPASALPATGRSGGVVRDDGVRPAARQRARRRRALSRATLRHDRGAELGAPRAPRRRWSSARRAGEIDHVERERPSGFRRRRASRRANWSCAPEVRGESSDDAGPRRARTGRAHPRGELPAEHATPADDALALLELQRVHAGEVDDLDRRRRLVRARSRPSPSTCVVPG